MKGTSTERFVDDAIAETQVTVLVVDATLSESIRRTVRERFALSRSYWLWEKLKDSVARRRDDGWSKATDYVGEKHAIFFLNESDGKRMWEFGSGQDLGRVLEASPPMESYLTDADVTCVLCLNHHDVLIGAGACKAWLSSERTHQ